MDITRRSLLLLTIIFSISANSYSQDREQIKPGDVLLFLTTYKKIHEDLKVIHVSEDSLQHDLNISVAHIPQNKEVREIFEKHNWKVNNIVKYPLILQSYSYLKLEKNMSYMSNSNRKDLENMLKKNRSELIGDVSDKELDLIKPYMADLQRLIVGI